MTKAIIILAVSLFISSNSAIAEVCRGNGAYHEGSPCVCPPPLLKLPAAGGGGYFGCFINSGGSAESSPQKRIEKPCEQRPEGCGVAIIRRDARRPRQCNIDEVTENFRWFHRDALVDAHTAEVRGKLMRFANFGETDLLRALFADGQGHNPDAAASIVPCDDATVFSIAYSVAEEGRLNACNAPPPARSASCHDVAENLRWALIEGKACAGFARAYVLKGVRGFSDGTLLESQAAQYVRMGFKSAQGHREEVYDSVDYIQDVILLRIAERVSGDTSASRLQSFIPIQSDWENERPCPGLYRMGQERSWFYK